MSGDNEDFGRSGLLPDCNGDAFRISSFVIKMDIFHHAKK